MKIYIMRHGETVWNRLGTIQGRSKNRLSKEGKIQVEKQAENFKDVHLDFIISSPLVRTIQTANIMNKFHNAKIIKDERINEVDQGIYTGRNKSTMTDADWSNYKTRSKKFGMESFDDIISRTIDFVEDLKSNYKDKSILIITHRSSAKAIFYTLTGKKVTSDELVESTLFGNAEVNLVEI